MNLDLGFKYDKEENGSRYREQAELLCKSEHFDCPIGHLKSMYFDGKKQKETKGITINYTSARRNLGMRFLLKRKK